MLELGLALLLAGAPAPQAPPPPAEISAQIGQEDGKPEIIATVKAAGKPVPNVGVTFTLARTFGDLPLGQDTTLDDGTAAAPFPKGLRPDQEGHWTFKIALTSPDAYAGQAKTLTIAAPAAGAPLPAATRRELWSRSAPWSVLLTVLVLVGGAWTVYAFAGCQLYRIHQGGKDA